jgi:hypothetical protein
VDALNVVGSRLPSSPAECLRAALRLQREFERLSPLKRTRGFVFKARTWKEFEEWRRTHPNPWFR